MAIAWPPLRLNAIHDPSASAGLMDTPSAVTIRSLRGKLTLYAPSGCKVPARPRASATLVQSCFGAAATRVATDKIDSKDLNMRFSCPTRIM